AVSTVNRSRRCRRRASMTRCSSSTHSTLYAGSEVGWPMVMSFSSTSSNGCFQVGDIRRRPYRSDRTGLARDRKHDSEGRAMADLALDCQLSAMADDHRARDRQSLAGAFAHGFGREERIEDSRQYRWRDAASAVGDIDPHTGAVAAGADRECAATAGPLRLDRVSRIDDQVQEHLVDLGAPAIHRRNVPQLELHVRDVLVLVAR